MNLPRRLRTSPLSSRLSLASMGLLVCLFSELASFTRPSLAQTTNPEPAKVLAVRGKMVHTMAGQVLQNAMVLVQDGKITAIGQADQLVIPSHAMVIDAEHVTPGLIDVRSTLGLTGILNTKQDQDQLDAAAPLQPELRAIDAYNGKDDLVDWVRGFGVTTVHTGHGPGELLAGQTLIVKLDGNSVNEALIQDGVAVVCTLGETARKSGKSSPGTRAKMMAMLRTELFHAKRYQEQRQASATASPAEQPAVDLRLEALAAVLRGEKALMITADREQDISSALRLAKEFSIRIWLESAAESYLLLDAIRDAQIPVLLHPTMARAGGERENLSFTTAAKLKQAGIPFAIESGFEAYVPKVRVVLFEAALAAAHGLDREAALAAITIEAAKILGIDKRVGSIEIGKDADLALYDGDPLEYTSHCTHTVINGRIVHQGKQ